MRAHEAELASDIVVERLQQIAEDMQRLGADASARIVMREAFAKTETPGGLIRLRVGVELLRMLVRARRFDEAVRVSSQLPAVASIFPTTTPEVKAYWDLKVEAELRAGYFEDCRQSMAHRQAIGLASPTDSTVAAELGFFDAKVMTEDGDDD